MKNLAGVKVLCWVMPVLFAMSFFSCSAQISVEIVPITFGPFNITPSIKTVEGKHRLYISVFKGNQQIITDSVITDVAGCQGFSFPTTQPFSDYFIFSKHQNKAGKTYILTKQGEFIVIAGGTFWAAPKDKLLFILAEKDYRNLAVFSLKEMKTVFEKYSCDEFTDWYYRKGRYFGKVATECGDALKPEKEVSEWMHPVEIEQFDVKQNALNEMHITDEQVEHAMALVKYAACK